MTSAYYFENFTDEEKEIMISSLKQAHNMLHYTINQVTNAIILIKDNTSSYNYSRGMNDLLKAAKIEFGGNDKKALEEIKDKLLKIKDKIRRSGMTIIKHNGKGTRNSIAEAETPGMRQWYGPDFFNEKIIKKNSNKGHNCRERIIIHEFGHSVGLDHEFQGAEITGTVNGNNATTKVTGIANVAIGADGLALFCYRIFKGKCHNNFNLMHFD